MRAICKSFQLQYFQTINNKNGGKKTKSGNIKIKYRGIVFHFMIESGHIKVHNYPRIFVCSKTKTKTTTKPNK